MIEGMRVTVSGKELVLLCKNRAIHHLERAEKYQLQIVSMKQNMIEGGMTNTSSGDPVKSLENRRDSHESEAAELTFTADHLVADETYLLGRDDLMKLGIATSRY